MPLRYKSGEEVLRGDRVMLHGEPGEIESVANPGVKDPETDWLVQEYGEGVMVHEPKIFGRLFIQPDDCDWIYCLYRDIPVRNVDLEVSLNVIASRTFSLYHRLQWPSQRAIPT